MARLRTETGASAKAWRSGYAHGGFYRDFEIAPRWIMTPHASVGVYSHGNKNEPGGVAKFQTGVDLLRNLGNGWRLGVTLRHLARAARATTTPASRHSR